MTTLLEEINIGVSAYPPLNLTTVPALKTVSSSGTTGISSLIASALVSQMAVIVANSPYPDVAVAVAAGAGVVTRANQAGVFIIGPLALSPNQLEKAGVIKPGASSYVASLLTSALAGIPAAQEAAEAAARAVPYYTQSDIDLARQTARTQTLAPEKIMPDSLFISGNLPTIINSPEKQVAILTTNLDQAIPALIHSGILTGKESTITIAGLLLSSVASCTTLEAGVTQTISAASRILSGQPVVYSPMGVPNIFGTPQEIMSAGLSAGRLSILASGLGPLISYLTSLGLTGDPDQMMDQAVMSNFPALPAEVSVDLSSSINSSPYKNLPWTFTKSMVKVK